MLRAPSKNGARQVRTGLRKWRTSVEKKDQVLRWRKELLKSCAPTIVFARTLKSAVLVISSPFSFIIINLTLLTLNYY